MIRSSKIRPIALAAVLVACGGAGTDESPATDALAGENGSASPSPPTGTSIGNAAGNAPSNAAPSASGTSMDSGAKPPPPPPPRCDVGKPFTKIGPIAGVNTTAAEGAPRFSQDELTIYFDRAGEIFSATRADRTQAFVGAAAIANVNSTSLDLSPSVSQDGLTLFLVSNRSTGGNGDAYDIYRATRTTTAAPFQTPALASAASVGYADAAFLQPDQSHLWFVSTRSNTGLLGYEAPIVGGDVGSVMAHPELGTGVDYPYTLVPSADGLVLYFAKHQGFDFHIWVGRRAKIGDPFTNIAPVPELSTQSNELPSWVSPDLCRVYFFSNRPGGQGASDLYVAERSP